MKEVIIANTEFCFSSAKNAEKFFDALANAPLHELEISFDKVNKVPHLFVEYVDLGKFSLKDYRRLLGLQSDTQPSS